MLAGAMNSFIVFMPESSWNYAWDFDWMYATAGPTS